MTHRDGNAHVPPELSALLAQIVPPGGRFGHRQHIHLAYLAVRQHGTSEAVTKVSGWIRHLATDANTPQKYHATITRAWTELVGYHVLTDPPATDFDDFATRHPALLDKRLLSKHYRPVTLASCAARSGWVEPDLAQFPWHH